MRYFLFVLLFVFTTQGISKEIIISCGTTLFKIANNEVYMRSEGEWNLYRGEKYKGYTRKVKTKPGKIIIITAFSNVPNYFSDVFDLKEITWNYYYTPKDHSEPSKRVTGQQCKVY
mgnify:CR=1 FL=1|jgi:hypothetical protein